MPSFAALLVAALASLPAFAITYYLVSGAGRPLAVVWAGFIATAPVAVPIYFAAALGYGFVLWVVLKALNLLSLLGLVVGSLIPVVALVLWQVAARGGPGPGVHVVLFALGLPCVIMAAVLWLFSSRGA